jgi:hypothetical protein
MQCVAFDPTEERIAAGDVSGRILIWSSFKDKVPQLQKPNTQPGSTPVAPSTAAASASTAKADTVMQPAAAEQDSDTDSDSDSDSSDSNDASAARQTNTASSSAATNVIAAKQGLDANQGEQMQIETVGPKKESLPDRFARMQNSVRQVPVTTVHWHAHPVGCLCFSADGTLLLSGGEEAVLVGAMPTSHAATVCLSTHSSNHIIMNVTATCCNS